MNRAKGEFSGKLWSRKSWASSASSRSPTIITSAALIKSLFENFREKKAAAKRAFKITEQNLVEKLSVTQIEQREVVTDPHDAVPELPFGHLNDAWVRYQRKLLPDHEIWSFSMTWENEWNGTEKVEGYVAVQNGQIGPHFISLRRSLSELD